MFTLSLRRFRAASLTSKPLQTLDCAHITGPAKTVRKGSDHFVRSRGRFAVAPMNHTLLAYERCLACMAVQSISHATDRSLLSSTVQGKEVRGLSFADLP